MTWPALKGQLPWKPWTRLPRFVLSIPIFSQFGHQRILFFEQFANHFTNFLLHIFILTLENAFLLRDGNKYGTSFCDVQRKFVAFELIA